SITRPVPTSCSNAALLVAGFLPRPGCATAMSYSDTLRVSTLKNNRESLHEESALLGTHRSPASSIVPTARSNQIGRFGTQGCCKQSGQSSNSKDSPGNLRCQHRGDDQKVG